MHRRLGSTCRTSVLLGLASLLVVTGCPKSSGSSGSPTDSGATKADFASAPDAASRDGGRPGCSQDGWCQVMKVKKGNLFGIWGIDSHDLYAIWGGVLVHELDLEWHVVPTGGQRVYSVHGVGHNDIWAVGDLGCLWHFTDRWQKSKNENTKTLRSVATPSSDSAWAVGDSGTILRYDGTDWKLTPSGTTQDLLGVWADSSGDAWAVGSSGTILHFTKNAWTTVKSPTTAPIGAIWGSSPTDIWAVGGAGTLIHYGGKLWSGGVPVTSSDLYAVWGTNPTDVWAVGGKGTIVHWDGNLWSNSPSGTEDELHGIWGTESRDMWTVGFSKSTGETSTFRRHL
jgi:hypothetical protein